MKIKNDKVYVKHSIIASSNVRNRGVFADVDIKKDEIIEICPVIKFNKDVFNLITDTELGFYPFTFGDRIDNISCLVLGYGEIYNHNKDANIHWYDDVENNTKVFYALKDISKNEELVYNYAGLNHDDSEILEAFQI